MIEVLRSGVNTWECDQMGHLNVRHYFARAYEGLAMLALQCGHSPGLLREGGLSLRARDQHVRFHRELRPGTPYVVSAGVLNASEERLQVFEEIRFATEPTLAATIVSDIVLASTRSAEPVRLSSEFVARARELTMELPEYGAPRGIPRDPPRSPPPRDEGIGRGLTGAYLGPVVREDCDEHGRMLESAFMARVADGIGHFFRTLRAGLRPDGIGGAALEYRYVFYRRPRLGDVIEVRSGLKGLGNKTLHICHWIFDVETGACLATSEAVVVSFDLTARKAVAIPDDARAIMQTRIIEGLSV
jgi:acyl-CoA thioester hydrolase